MNLAKLEAKVALGVLLARCRDITLADPQTAPEFHKSFVLRGIGSLPVVMQVSEKHN
jgi:cytochrome P450